LDAPSRWRVSTAEHIKREKGVSLKAESQQCFIPKTSLKNVTLMVFWARAQIPWMIRTLVCARKVLTRT
jgi:lambda repressor-like predicted transcriptional regulator